MGNNEIVSGFSPDVAIPPGETLLESLEVLGMTQAEFARRMERPLKTINRIIHGKEPITIDTALQLERIMGIPAEFWSNLESQYQIARAKIAERRELRSQVNASKRFPYAAMAKCGWVSKTRDPVGQVTELLAFFNVRSLANLDYQKWGIAYRRALGSQISREALLAWLQQGERLARQIRTEAYDEKRFIRSLVNVRDLIAHQPDGFANSIQSECAKAGVAVVFVPHLRKTYVNGATQWVTPTKAIIQLSLRYRYADILWFSLLHEAAHILLHGKKKRFLELDDCIDDMEEREANEYAANMLIPCELYNDFVARNDFSQSAIRGFAESVKTSPGVVVGRLQHDKHVDYSRHAGLRSKLKWVDECD